MLLNFMSRMEEYAGSEMYSKIGIKSLVAEKAREIDFETLRKFVTNDNIRKSTYPAEYTVAAEHFVARELDSEEFSKKMAHRVKPILTEETIRDVSEEDLQEIVSKMIGTI